MCKYIIYNIYINFFRNYLVYVQNAAKVERLIKERSRIIAEHDDGEIFIEDGKILSGGSGGGDAAGKPSDSAAKVLFMYL